ncbi:UDP-glucose:undecaprenyl-phosphate glucose-1-phosphate transferase [Stieleria maiorica]|uniref:UDP-glucose:undecaprenyl-phosphate glucose-1-phosphate transferase n=1 Tax=Stieleria maiorica TaxID=2795974 RepID=A0A5B9M782_9BACT|nr:undecaprenyl-phosphate glucose phosphotransferase [Stieleria maiorica]QEF97011.1 UDP-glucose:undecaprenyl-phosphate glucose-1-phosphate transferase [Stieleria maiorica]
MPESSFDKRSPIAGERHSLDLLQPTLDAISILGSLYVVKQVARGWMDDAGMVLGLLAVIIFLILSKITGVSRTRDRGNANDEITAIMVTWVMTVMSLTVIGFATRYGEVFARSLMFIWAVIAPMMVALSRMLLRIIQQSAKRRGYGTRRVAIAGLNTLGRQTAKNIDAEPALGFNLVGFFDDRVEDRPTQSVSDMKDNLGSEAAPDDNATLSGNLSELVDQCRGGQIDTVMVTLPMRAEDRIRYLLDQLSDSTVSVYIVPDFFVFELLHSRWTNMGGLPAVSVFENPLFGVDGVLKRIADVTIASAALLVAAIPMTMIAIAVKLTSKGPVFFRQKRYGLDGKEILVWKFRSMRTCDNGPVVKQATKGDPRITKLGAILRKTSLDELPQLFNVIEGTMSLVGPRPHASAHNEQYRGQIRGYMLRHKVKPGITGLAQVNGCRGETETIEKMEQRIQWDHQYIRRWSLWLDLKILFKTVLVVWKQETAY